MQTTTTILALLAAVQSAFAVEFTNSAFVLKAGTPFTLTWDQASGPVTIVLNNGPSTALTPVETIVAGATASSFTWTPPATLPTDTYAFSITDSTKVPNYSVQFQFAGAAPASTTVSALSTITSTATTVSGSTTNTASTSNSASMMTGSSTSSSSQTSTSTSSKTSSTSSSSTSTPNTSNGGKLAGSPFALVLGAMASFLMLN